MLIGLTLVLQAIRVFFPIPPQVNAYLIGTLIHMMMVVSLVMNGMTTAIVLALILPLTAFVQGQVLFPIFIPVIMFGNILFLLLVNRWRENKKGIFLPPLIKAICMCWLGWYALVLIKWNGVPQARWMMGAFSTPQVVTGILGILLARRLIKALPREYK
ncbi:MAG: hypothetical protein Q4D21_06790 [Phascolarctobacterium sp.]|nr:hypothetical protein [Phascolarctobacterium sp.]